MTYACYQSFMSLNRIPKNFIIVCCVIRDCDSQMNTTIDFDITWEEGSTAIFAILAGGFQGATHSGAAYGHPRIAKSGYLPVLLVFGAAEFLVG